MIKQITWDRLTNFTGRNGFFKCSGIELFELGHSKELMLTPLTSRGNIANCNIIIPVEAIPQLIEELKKFIWEE
jgi:hypothetical protein